MAKASRMPARSAESQEVARARQWILDPLSWAYDMFPEHEVGGVKIPAWCPSPQQLELWEAYRLLTTAKLKRLDGVPLLPAEAEVVDKHGISVMAGHGLGKEGTVAPLGLHFLNCMRQPKVICTAPAGPTLFSTLWPEFGKWISRSPYLPELVQKQSNRVHKIEDKEENRDLYCIRPRTIQPNSSPDAQGEVLAGIHSISVLYLITEASGVPEAVIKPIEGGLTDPVALVIQIFNPTRTTGFAIESQRKFRKNWICLHWDGEEMAKYKQADPQKYFWFNDKAQVALAEKYGKDSNVYRIRVKGLPPLQAEDTLIGWDDAMAATERQIAPLPNDPIVISVDVAGEGADKTIVGVSEGPRLVEIHEFEKKNTTEISWLVKGILARALLHVTNDRQFAIGVDVIGLGRGVYDQLVNVELLTNVYPIDVSEKPLEGDRFHRLRDELYWQLRERVTETRDVQICKRTEEDPGGIEQRLVDEAVAEMTSIKWAEVQGKIKIETKDKMKGRGLNSPNIADMLAMREYLLRRCVSRMPVAARRRTRFSGGRPTAKNWKTV